jgi:G patch domain-containing protein 1
VLLGEQPIKARSVFDYIKQADRRRIENLTKPKEASVETEHKVIETPYLDPRSAKAALNGYAPFSTDMAKQMRYREFLEFKAGQKDSLPRTQKVAAAYNS